MGKPVSQRFPLALERLPKRYQRILKTVGAIPCGYVATYGEVAKVCATGPRVVGRAMATNPFPLLIPCHRVVRSNLTLAGHGAGKRFDSACWKKRRETLEKRRLFE
ncbi:MAG TPA: MGMT family protein [Candidatus Bathyarchaeota archaeon]|nr:MGMT family protein [Candidatus Bathyarchaeota archaeon]